MGFETYSLASWDLVTDNFARQNFRDLASRLLRRLHSQGSFRALRLSNPTLSAQQNGDTHSRVALFCTSGECGI